LEIDANAFPVLSWGTKSTPSLLRLKEMVLPARGPASLSLFLLRIQINSDYGINPLLPLSNS